MRRSFGPLALAGAAIIILLSAMSGLAALPFTPGHLPSSVYAQENTPPAQPASGVPGGFVQVAGSQLARIGQPVQIKGVYYEPQGYTAYEMWRYWDSNRIARDLQLARDLFGVNAVWVRLPYGVGDVTPPGQISDEMLLRIRELLQIVGNLDMRLVFTLFDGYEAFPMPGRNSERLNIEYMKHLIGSFAGDERILGWNIYHQPDRHGLWKGGEKQRVVSWLVRMANQVHTHTPNQLVMLNLSNYANVWEADFDGHVLYDHVDVIMMRGTDSEEIIEDVAAIRERTTKPVLLYDYAWASGPPCRARKNTEEQQAAMHRDMVTTLAQGHVAGVFLRTLHDIDSGPLNTWDDDEFYNGLLRLNYTPKLVQYDLLAYPVAPLPNVTTTNLPLRTVSHKEPYYFDPDSESDSAPRPIPGTDHYVKRDMRRVWDTFGGRYSLGLPLTEAYKRAEDNRVVQYFEAAVLELHPDVRDDEEYQELGHLEKLMARVRVTDVGLEYTAGRTFPPPEREYAGEEFFEETGHYLKGEFRRFYKYVNGPWRLGMPLSEEMTEEVNGVPMNVQYFEKGRVEQDLQTGDIRLGQLGSWRFAVQCANMP